MFAPRGHVIPFLGQPVFALPPLIKYCLLSKEAKNTNFIVYGLTWSRVETWTHDLHHLTTNHYWFFYMLQLVSSHFKEQNAVLIILHIQGGWVCVNCGVTSLSTVFQLYCGSRVYWCRKSGVPGENHQPVASHWQTWSHNVVSRTPRPNGIQTHNFRIDMDCKMQS